MGEHVRLMLAGPGTLRFILQPTLAILIGVLHGWRDARLRRMPYIKSLIRSRGDRAALLRHGVTSIALPLTIALGASVVFQYIVRSRVRLALAVLYAATFVAVPYFVARSLTHRAATWRQRRRHLPTGPLRPAT